MFICFLHYYYTFLTHFFQIKKKVFLKFFKEKGPMSTNTMILNRRKRKYIKRKRIEDKLQSFSFYFNSFLLHLQRLYDTFYGLCQEHRMQSLHLADTQFPCQAYRQRSHHGHLNRHIRYVQVSCGIA